MVDIKDNITKLSDNLRARFSRKPGFVLEVPVPINDIIMTYEKY